MKWEVSLTGHSQKREVAHAKIRVSQNTTPQKIWLQFRREMGREAEASSSSPLLLLQLFEEREQQLEMDSSSSGQRGKWTSEQQSNF